MKKDCPVATKRMRRNRLCGSMPTRLRCFGILCVIFIALLLLSSTGTISSRSSVMAFQVVQPLLGGGGGALRPPPTKSPFHPKSSESSLVTMLYSAPPKKKDEISSNAASSLEQRNNETTQQSMEDSLVRLLERKNPPGKIGGGTDQQQDSATATSSSSSSSQSATTATNVDDLVLVGKDTLNLLNDPYLQIVSSEIGIKQLNGEETGDAAVAQAILFERTLDTIEDIFLHIRRIPCQQGWTSAPASLSSCMARKTVVVLGSGWGAHALMKVADCFKIKLIVVSPTNHFVFTPMLASAAVGTVEYRSMTEAVRDANPMIDSFIEGKAIDVDVERKTIQVQLNPLLNDVDSSTPPIVDVPYDHLVVAVGNQVSFYNTPGAEERCLRLKTCDDARRLRTAVGEAFEYASRPDVTPAEGDDEATRLWKEQERARRVTFVMIGGGPTGVELAGELSDFIHDITKERVGSYTKLHGVAKVVLVHGGSELLTAFEDDLRHEALRSLEKRGVEVLLNTKVTEVGQKYAKISKKVLDANGEPTGETEDSTLPLGLSVWCAGIAPVPFVDKLLQKLAESARGVGGRVNVDRWLRAPMPSQDLMGSVLVLGDAASLQSRKKASYLPQTAQVAGQQGAYAARMLVRGYNLTAEIPVLPQAQEITPFNTTSDPLIEAWLKFRNIEAAPGFSFLNLGLLAYLGGGKALSQVQIGDVPVFSYAGSVAFVLWRSVYLVKQVATRNRVLVTFDWIKSTLFGRDTTRL